MLEKTRLKLWQWLLLFLIGFLFPLYNILLNNFIVILNIRIPYIPNIQMHYIILVMITTVIFSCILFLIFNFFRKRTGYEKRMDSAFMLYVLSVSFGSFFKDLTSGIGIFALTFLIAYFLEIKKVLDEFPRD